MRITRKERGKEVIGAVQVLNELQVDGNATVNGDALLNGALSVKRASVNADYTTSGDTIVGVDSSGGAVTVRLSSSDAQAGRVVIVKDEGGKAGTNNITITTEGGETIDGGASVTISSNYGVVRLYSDGSNWFTF